jgi:hypothetical protein
MLTMASVRTVMRAVHFVERPIAWLDGLLSIMAGEVKGVRRGTVQLKLNVSLPEFDAITARPDVREAMTRALVMK